MSAWAALRTRFGVWAAAALVVLPASNGAVLAAAPARYEGRSIAEVLDHLQDASLTFLFSSELVPDSLRVVREPHTRDRLNIARELLAEHGLVLRAVTPSLYIVTRAANQVRHRVTGQVVDELGAGIAGARIELVPLGRITWSDASGDFSFSDIESGDGYRLVATIGDHARGETALNIRRDDAVGRIAVRTQPMALDTVVVEASRYELVTKAPPGALRLTDAQLIHQPDVAEDPIRALRRLPGVVQGGISAASNLRGGETNEVMMLLDGFPLRQVYHLSTYQSPFSLLDESLVGTIDVFTGGFPARYGNRLAGVFDITSPDPQAPFTGTVGVSFFNAHARVAGGSEDQETDWRAAVRVGTLRPVLQYLSVDAGSPSYNDLALAVTHRPSDQLALTAQVLSGDDEYELDDDDESAQVESRTRYTWIRADYLPNDSLATSLIAGYSKLQSDRIGAVAKPEFAVSDVADHRDAEFRDLRGDLSWQWSERSRLNAGFELTRSQANYRYDATAEFPELLAELYGREPALQRNLRVTPEQRRVALYLSHRWKLSEEWMPELGLRVQELSVDGASRDRTWDPRVGIRWEAGPRTALRLHWGRFHQSDEVHELAIADGVTQFSDAQRSEHVILGFEHDFSNGAQLRVEGFRKRQGQARARFENLMSPIEVFPEVAPDRVRIDPDAAEIRGIEASMTLERESWSAWSSIAMGRARDEIAGAETVRSWDQRFAWGVGIDWHRGQWRVGAAASVRDGWPSTPILFDEEEEAVLGTRNSRRLGNYGALDASVEYRRPLAVGSLAVRLQVSNLTNRRNDCCFDVEVEDVGGSDEAITVESKRWPGVLPSLSIAWEY